MRQHKAVRVAAYMDRVKGPRSRRAVGVEWGLAFEVAGLHMVATSVATLRQAERLWAPYPPLPSDAGVQDSNLRRADH